MKNKKYYSGVRYKKRNMQTVAIGVLSAVLFLLVILIIWAIAVFGGGSEGAFEDQSSRLSTLKIENESLRLENRDLKEENKRLSEEIEKYKSGEYSPSPSPEITQEPEDDEQEKTPRPKKTPLPTPTAEPTPDSSPFPEEDEIY